MHPVIIIFALLAGEHAFGIWGALLAVPTMSVLLSCFRFYLYEVERMPAPKEADNHFLGTLWARLKQRFQRPDGSEGAA